MVAHLGTCRGRAPLQRVACLIEAGLPERFYPADANLPEEANCAPKDPNTGIHMKINVIVVIVYLYLNPVYYVCRT